jgi:hypothetical protein
MGACYLSILAGPQATVAVGQFGPFFTVNEAQAYEREILARYDLGAYLRLVYAPLDVPTLTPHPLTGALVGVTLAHGKEIPPYAVADFIVQSGLTRDQLRWGCDLALHWDMVSRKQLDRWIDRVDVLGLDDLLPHVGPADIEDEAEYRAIMAKEARA